MSVLSISIVKNTPLLRPGWVHFLADRQWKRGFKVCSSQTEDPQTAHVILIEVLLLTFRIWIKGLHVWSFPELFYLRRWCHIVCYIGSNMSVFNCNYVQTRQQSWTFYGNARWFFYKSLVSKRWVMWKNWSCVGSYFKIRSFNNFFVSLQPIPKTGRTILCPETPTTWWEPTVCPCSSTTSEEGRYWMWRRWTHWQHSTPLCMKTQSAPFTVPDDEGKTATIDTSCYLNVFP